VTINLAVCYVLFFSPIMSSSITSRDVTEAITSILTCYLCSKPFVDSRRLPLAGCQHAFCLKCILALTENMKPGEKARCPRCPMPYSIPTTGCTDLDLHLPIHCVINSIVATLANCAPDPNQSYEDLIFKGEPLSSHSLLQRALTFSLCTVCEELLCYRCLVQHSKQFATHRLRPSTSDINSLGSLIEKTIAVQWRRTREAESVENASKGAKLKERES